MGERLSSSVYWRRRAAVAAGAVAAVGVLWAGTEAVVDALEHSDDPIPAGCETDLREGQDFWTIASLIDADNAGQISWEIGRANPDMEAGALQPGPIGIPQEYCDEVQQPGFNQPK